MMLYEITLAAANGNIHYMINIMNKYPSSLGCTTWIFMDIELNVILPRYSPHGWVKMLPTRYWLQIGDLKNDHQDI